MLRSCLLLSDFSKPGAACIIWTEQGELRYAMSETEAQVRLRATRGREEGSMRSEIYTPKSNPRNRIHGTNCAENAVSCIGFLFHRQPPFHALWGVMCGLWTTMC
eukprot:1582574-Rhodomonas_salina.1